MKRSARVKCDYSSARDLFEAARSAAIELSRIRRRLEELQSPRSGDPLQGGSGARADVNGMGATIALVDLEGRYRSIIAEDESLLAFASLVLYGEGGEGGLAALLDSSHAEVVFRRYLEAETWDEVAEAMFISRRSAIRYAGEAFDVIDAHGFSRTISGRGIAED